MIKTKVFFIYGFQIVKEISNAKLQRYIERETYIVAFMKIQNLQLLTYTVFGISIKMFQLTVLAALDAFTLSMCSLELFIKAL